MVDSKKEEYSEGSDLIINEKDESPALAANKKLLRSVGQVSTKVKGSGGLDQYGEFMARDELPWLKDPSQRTSIWSMIKNNIGKDLSRISLPVYLNEPASILQKPAQATEYQYLLGLAA